MIIYQTKKNLLKPRKITQIPFKWILPILVNTNNEIVAGNCIYDNLPEKVLFCRIEKNQMLEDNLFYVEQKVVEENDINRVKMLDFELREYFKCFKKYKGEKISLFGEIKERGLISEENYIVRKDAFKSHNGKKKEEIDENQICLWEDAVEVVHKKEKSSSYNDFEVDMEILKEIM